MDAYIPVQPKDTPAMTRDEAKVIFASSFGAMLEWYDFYIYAALATYFSVLFFPKGNETANLLASLATFGAGFLVRPIGAIVFGRLGDLVGRKYTFLITVVLMGLSTLGVGLLPSYARIGIAAPILLVLLRLLQGLALGGETGGASVYLGEHSPPKRRGFYTSALQTTGALGWLVSIGVVAGARLAVGSEAFAAWGWRIPFLVSVVLLGVSVWLRAGLRESPTFQHMKNSGTLSKKPLTESFARWGNLKYVLVLMFSCASGVGALFGTSEFYSMYFLANTLRVPFSSVNLYLAVALAASMPFFLFFGWLSDRIGRKWIMASACLLAAVTTIPIFHGLTHYANPDLEAFERHANVEIAASDCHFSLFSAPATDCDRVRNFMTSAGVSYRLVPAAPAAPVSTTVGTTIVKGAAPTELKAALMAAGWSPSADPAKINGPMVTLLVWLLLLYLTMIYGPMAAFLVELFPARIRYTSLSLPYHVGSGWFGGMLPMVVTAIAVAYGNIYIGLWYTVAVSMMSLIVTVLFVPETFRRDITQ